MIIGNSTAQYKAMNRMQACTYTIRTLLAELEDPGSIELRADLAIQAQELLNEVVLLSDRISSITWQELDQKAHPSDRSNNN
jgi:hypothetical protein